jgi:hypothetical protein
MAERKRIPAKNGSRNLHSGVFVAQLQRLREAFRTRRPRREMKSVFIQQDNARPHCTKEVTDLIASFEWTLLPHPPYSPTEAPTDYHVNRSMKNFLLGKNFETFADLCAAVKQWIASKDSVWFSNGVGTLPHRWEAVIEVDGDYAEEREWEVRTDLFEY